MYTMINARIRASFIAALLVIVLIVVGCCRNDNKEAEDSSNNTIVFANEVEMRRYLDNAACAIYGNRHMSAGDDTVLVGSGLLVSKSANGIRKYMVLTAKHVSDIMLEYPQYVGYSIGLLSLTNDNTIIRVDAGPKHDGWLESDSENDIALLDITHYIHDFEQHGAKVQCIDLDSIGELSQSEDRHILLGVGVAPLTQYAKLDVVVGISSAFLVAVDSSKTNAIDNFHRIYESPFINSVGTIIYLNEVTKIDGLIDKKHKALHTVHRIEINSNPGESGGGIYLNDPDCRPYLLGMAISCNGKTTGMIPIERVIEHLDKIYNNAHGDTHASTTE